MKTEAESRAEWARAMFPRGTKVRLIKGSTFGPDKINVPPKMAALFDLDQEFTVLGYHDGQNFPDAVVLDTYLIEISGQRLDYNYSFDPSWIKKSVPTLTEVSIPTLDPVSEKVEPARNDGPSLGAVVGGTMATIFGLAAGKSILGSLFSKSEQKQTKIAEQVVEQTK